MEIDQQNSNNRGLTDPLIQPPSADNSKVFQRLNAKIDNQRISDRSQSQNVKFNSLYLDTADDRLQTAKKVFIKVGELVETFFGKLYQIIISTVITTVFINGENFSYITDPVNDERNFFLLREGDYFDINQWDPTMTGNKISEEKMQEFVAELNFFFSTNDIFNIVTTNNKRKRLRVMGLILCLLCLTGSSILLWRVIDTIYEHIYLIVTFGLITLACLICTILMIYRTCFYNSEEQMNYDIFINLLQHKEIVEDHVQKWNKEFFIERGVMVYSTPIVNYIHFSLEVDKILILNNNEISVKGS